MRFRNTVLAAAALMLVGSAAIAQTRETSSLNHPAGDNTVILNGSPVSAAGRALYFFDKDEDGVSKCVGQCVTAWPPLRPGEGAKEGGGWTIITRPDGSRQWAYKGRPVYVFFRDKADRVATGAQVISGWRLAK